MKKIWKYIFILLNTSTMAQITLEHQYYIYKKNLYVWDIGSEDFKYVLFDSTGFSLFNLDHSPFLLNVSPPIPLWQPPSFYEVGYITKTLFDCDSTNIEYVVTQGINKSNFYIYRTDGTLLFEKDSVTGPYCAGCFDGSLYLRPIFNTPNGTKLMLQDNNGQIADSLYIYSLCGTLPNSAEEVSSKNNYVEVYPNPSSGIVNFQINISDIDERFKLIIYNSSFQKIEEGGINEKNYQLNIKKRSLNSGIYFFELRTEVKVYQTGKFIISN